MAKLLKRAVTQAQGPWDSVASQLVESASLSPREKNPVSKHKVLAPKTHL